MKSDGVTYAVSLIVPTLNEEKYLPSLLESLARLSSAIEILIVDGHSIDGTTNVVDRFTDRFHGLSSVRVIPCERGIARQRNAGAAEASHEILMFLDADVIAPDDIEFQKMLSEFVDGTYAVAAPLLIPDESDLRARLIFFNAHFFQRIMSLFGKAYFPGMCILTRADVFRQVGGFDENMRVGEDVDYCIRACAQGRFKLFSTHLIVSTRRFKKYGYGHVYVQWVRATLETMVGRSASLQRIVYPFGEF